MRTLRSADRSCSDENRLSVVQNVSEQFKSWKIILMEACVLLLRERAESDQQIAQGPANPGSCWSHHCGGFAVLIFSFQESFW